MDTGGLTRRWVGSALAVGDPAVTDPVAAALPPEPGRLAMVVDPEVWRDTPELLADLLAEQRMAVRLVLSHAGAGPRPLAQWLADRTGQEITAPGGNVLLVPGGSLFVQGCWRTFRQRAQSTSHSPRHPLPMWERELPAPGADLRLAPVPAGWLLHSGDEQGLHELLHSVPSESDRPVLFLGAVSTQECAAALSALPVQLRRRLLVTGCAPSTVGIGQELADLIGDSVWVRQGLTMVGRDGGRHQVVVDDTGRPAFRPCARVLHYRPGAPWPLIAEWTSPAEALPTIAPAILGLTANWVAEIVPSGLWVRPSHQGSSDAVRAMPPDSARFQITLGMPDLQPPGDLWPATAALIAQLPLLRNRIRLVVPAVGGTAALHEAARLADEVTTMGTMPVASLPGVSWCRHDRRPVPAVSRPTPDLTGRAVPCGRSWDGPELAGVCGTTPAYLALVGADGRGFRVQRRSVPPVALAAMIRADPARRGRPVLLVADWPGHTDSDLVIAPQTQALAEALETEVFVPDGPLHVRGDGVLAADGGFWKFRPGAEAPVWHSTTWPPRRPRPTMDAPMPPVTVDEPVSDAMARQRFRTMLSTRYDAYAQIVGEALARRPSLRGNDTDEVCVPELVAVLSFLAGEDPSTDNGYAACLTAGLRRMPTHRGAVFRVSEGVVPRSGAELHEPGFTATTGSAAAYTDGNLEYVILSGTGRRAGLLDPGLPWDEVVFLPHTRFQVLDVEERPDLGVVRVFAAELSAVDALAGPQLERVVQRLRSAADMRDAVPFDQRFGIGEAARYASALGSAPK